MTSVHSGHLSCQNNQFLRNSSQVVFDTGGTDSRSVIQFTIMVHPHPHPYLRQVPPPSPTHSKDSVRVLAKAKVVDYWEKLLWSEAKQLSSLKYFLPGFMSLVKPHPLWKTCQGNPRHGCYRAAIARKSCSNISWRTVMDFVGFVLRKARDQLNIYW